MQAPLLVPSHREFLLRRLHSLSGVFPVGVFLIEHLWINAKATAGQPAFDRAVRELNHLPLLPLVEIFGIFLPLGFHALYGVKLAFESQPNVGKYPISSSWLYTMQRVTGLLAFAFIAWHLWEFRIAKLLGRIGTDDFYPRLVSHLSSTVSGVPLLAVVYLIGVAAAVLHLAVGLWVFCFSWGLCVSRRSQRLFAAAFAAMGAIVFVLGVTTVLYFATGVRFLSIHGSSSSSTLDRCSVVDP